MDRRPNKKIPETAYGLITIDPGTTTGMSWGVYDLARKAPSVFDLVARDMRMVTDIPQRDPGKGRDWRDSEREMSRIIAWRIADLRHRWSIAGLPIERQFLVWEDFILYPNQDHGSERSGLSPVRVTECVAGILLRYGDFNYRYQGAGEAKGFATNERLKQHGLWVRGEPEHHRDAKRHACLAVARLIEKGSRY